MDLSLRPDAELPPPRRDAPPLEPSLGAALDAAPDRFYAKGAVLVEAGRPLAAWHVVRKGWACRQRAFGGAAAAVLELYLPGDLIGPEAEFAEPMTESVVALTPITVGSVPVA